jgi:hypothetical protein
MINAELNAITLENFVKIVMILGLIYDKIIRI